MKAIRRIGELNCFVLLAICAVSVLVSWSALKGPMDRLIAFWNPPYTLTLEVLEETNPQAVPNREVWINHISLGGVEDMERLYSTSGGSGFEYRNANDYGYSNDVITNVTGQDSTIRFEWDAGGEDVIEFWKQNLSGVVSLTLSKGDKVLQTEKLDLFSSEAGVYETVELNTVSGDFSIKFTALRWGCVGLAGAILFVILSAILAAWVTRNTGKPENGGDDNG